MTAQPILMFWQECTECHYETVAHGRVKCPNDETALTSVALAGSVVDDRSSSTEPSSPEDGEVVDDCDGGESEHEYPIRVENRYGRSVPVFDCDCQTTLKAESGECDACGARYELVNEHIEQRTPPMRVSDD
jgi:hypothetical protein